MWVLCAFYMPSMWVLYAFYVGCMILRCKTILPHPHGPKGLWGVFFVCDN